MSITQRILFHVALGTSLVVAVVTATTYGLVYHALEQRVLKQLEIYVAERTRREELGFRTIYSNLEVVRGQFLKRDETPLLPDAQSRWDQRFMRYPDGGWRNREEFYGPRLYSNLWARRTVEITPLFQSRVLRAQEICEELQPGWIDSFPSVYFIFPGPATMGYDPRIPRWCWQTPGDYDLEAEEWVKAAMPERNPSRGFVWTGVFVDEPTQQPFVTVQLPIDKDGHQIASVAHDMHINQFFEEMAHSDFPGATHLIFRPDGRLIAHPAWRSRILASNGALTLQASGDASLANLYQITLAHQERQFSGYEPISGSYFSASRLPEAEWFFTTMLPQRTVQQQAYASARWVLWSGLLSLALVLGFIALILRRGVAVPLRRLAQATRAMREGDIQARVHLEHRRDELGALAISFDEMATRVAERDAELRGVNTNLERRVAERTAELKDALDREKELGELKTNFVSLVSHEFRTPLGVIMSAAEVLHRYFDRLTAERRERHLEMIFRSTKNLANLMEEVLLLGRLDEGRLSLAPKALDLARLCREFRDEILSSTGGVCPIEFRPADSLEGAVSDEGVLRHILCNLLSNAVKYSEPGQLVTLETRRSGRDAIFTVRDRGIGIPLEDHGRLFTSFTRGRNVSNRPGTGLGLVIVHRCVQLHRGQIGLESEVGRGTAVTVTLPIFEPPTTPS